MEESCIQKLVLGLGLSLRQPADNVVDKPDGALFFPAYIAAISVNVYVGRGAHSNHNFLMHSLVRST